MKNFYYSLFILICSLTTTLNAQNSSVAKGLIAKGNSVYIEVEDKNKNTDGLYDSFKRHLLGSEWNRWELVDTKEEATYICRLHVEKKGFNAMSFTSMGARVRTVIEILTIDGKSVWKSKRQQGNMSVYTGGDALSDAMRKVIRRSIKEELYGESSDSK